MTRAPGAAPPAAASTGPATSVEALAGALPRTPLAVLPTPLAAAPRLAAALGTGPLLVKRDDLTGFAFGGNKARLLEFLVAAAVADGAGTLLTGGAAGSNFCAATAAAARRAGVPERDSVDAALPAAARELAAAGRRPYLIPRGGATGLGAVGYALAAAELHAQLDGLGLGGQDVTVVVPTGSGGTLAGVVAGHVLLGRPWTLLGCSASRPPRAAQQRVLTLARECLRLLGVNQEPGPADATVVDARGPGHGLPSPDGLAAAEQAMRTEGIMLDPVYTAKALAQVPGGRPVVFWHTGGVLDAVAAAQEAVS